MRILVYGFKGFYMNDYIESFIALGNEVKCIFNNEENIREYSEKVYGEMTELIDSFKPDFVFSMAYFEYILELCNTKKVKYVSWIFDNPANDIYSKSTLNKHNYIFFFDKSQYDEFKTYEEFKTNDTAHIYYLPLSANVDRLDKILINNDDIAKYSAEVSFVGRLYENNKYNEFKSIPGYIQGYVDALIEAQLNFSGYNFIKDSISVKFIEMFKKLVNIDEEINIKNQQQFIAQYYLDRKCTEIERKRTLNDITTYANLTIFSDVNLDSIPNAIKKESIEPVNTVPKVYKLSKINLNITLKSIIEGLPLRIFDVMGSGGFLITNYQRCIEEHFDIGKDIVVYHSLEDLKDKILYYLEHEDERKEIAYNGYMKVRNNHSMINKLDYITEQVMKDEQPN